MLLGFFRSGEITVSSAGSFCPKTHLTFEDVTVDSRQAPTLLRIRLKESKTDPFRVGGDVFIGKTDNELCPVAAVLVFMVSRGNAFFSLQVQGRKPADQAKAGGGVEANT